MSRSGPGWNPAGKKNPFSPTAVARVAGFAVGAITIETSAVRQARQLLDDYLASSASADQNQTDVGNVLAIVGDYGTGKTHLAVELRRHARRVSAEQASAMYLDAPADTFIALYRRFISGLQRDEVRARVREYYADVVINSLSDSDLTADVASRADLNHMLHQGALSPEDVVDVLGLPETTFLQQLQRRLQDVSEKPVFSTALTLLVRPGFESAAWDWLLGYPPDEILVERGIETAIDTDSAALEALGVIALLYGHRDRRFVLIIDELDKVLSASNSPPAYVIVAFKTLLRVFTGARAFLVLCGLPDFLTVLGPDLQQRIGHVVTMSALNGSDVCRFIEQSQQLANGTAELQPFTSNTVEYLVQLTAGIPRRVIRLCYQVYRQAVEDRTLATEVMVRQMARSHFDVASSVEVRAEVRRAIVANGWNYFVDHAVGATRDSKVDYWIPVGEQRGGCAILVTESVLDGDDLEKLNRRALAIRVADSDIEILLVVNGYLASNAATELAGMFGTQPLRYDHQSFDEDLTAIIKASLHRLENVVGEDNLAVIRERVDRINRQQTNTYGFIEQVAVRLDDLHSSTGHQFNVLHRRLDDVIQAVSGGKSLRSRDLRYPGSTPVEITQIFDNALEALGGVDQLSTFLANGFAGETQDSVPSLEDRRVMIANLITPETVQSIGAAALLQHLIKAFQDSVIEWFHSAISPPADADRLDDEERLASLCHTYDQYYEHLPPLRLESLAEFGRLVHKQDFDFFRMTQASQRMRAQENLENLSHRIYRAGLSAIDTRTEQ